jgi:predicted ABC-type exoprotein transport system permease subunit
MANPPGQEDSRYAAVRQYSLVQILAVWAAAAIPMAVLAWVIAPLLGALLGGGDTAFIKALLLCLTAGLIWQFVLTLILVRREREPFDGRGCAMPSGCSHPAIRGAGAWVGGSGCG